MLNLRTFCAVHESGIGTSLPFPMSGPMSAIGCKADDAAQDDPTQGSPVPPHDVKGLLSSFSVHELQEALSLCNPFSKRRFRIATSEQASDYALIPAMRGPMPITPMPITGSHGQGSLPVSA
jgi:hypothetical protein